MLLLALVFAAGAAVGLAADRLDLFAGDRRSDDSAETASPEPEGPAGERRARQTAIEEFADELGLTGEQRTQIESFLDHYREGARRLQQAVRPSYAALMDSVRTQIESVLTEDQVEDYRTRLRQRYRDRRERGRPDRSDPDRSDPDRND